LSRGGFPEPYLAETDEEVNRWRMQYVDGLIRNDILDFEKVHDFKAIQLTLEILRHRVGSPLSFSSLARDIHCSPNTIKRYVEILEALFLRRFSSFSGSRPIIAILHGHFSKSQRYTFTIRV
jgi:predicted AAA+ superfamily ATPase